MSSELQKKLLIGIKVLLILAGSLYLAAFLFVTLSRLGYRFELEWVEGSCVDSVGRLLAGKAIYDVPNINYIANVYTPLFYYVSYIFSLILGLGFFSLRLVSFISTLGIFGILFVWVRRETGQIIPALFSAFLFVATYQLSGSWFDLARTDMLFIIFYLLAAFALRFARNSLHYCFSALLFFLAFFAKQSVLFMFLPLVIYALVVDWKNGLLFLGINSILILLSTVWMDWIFNGWYSYYVFYLPGLFTQQLDWGRLVPFLTSELALPLFIAILIGIASLMLYWRKNKKLAFWFYVLLVGGALCGILPSRLYKFAYINTIIPIYAVIALLAGIGLGMLFHLLRQGAKARFFAFELILCFGCITQFVLFAYDPFKLIPTQMDEAAGDHFITVLKSFPGHVLVPYHSYIPTLAGKESHAHTTCINAIITSDQSPVKQRLEKEMSQALNSGYFQAFILDKKDNLYGYFLAGTVFENDEVFWTVTGEKTRPNFVYLAKDNH